VITYLLLEVFFLSVLNQFRTELGCTVLETKWDPHFIGLFERQVFIEVNIITPLHSSTNVISLELLQIFNLTCFFLKHVACTEP